MASILWVLKLGPHPEIPEHSQPEGQDPDTESPGGCTWPTSTSLRHFNLRKGWWFPVRITWTPSPIYSRTCIYHPSTPSWLIFSARKYHTCFKARPAASTSGSCWERKVKNHFKCFKGAPRAALLPLQWSPRQPLGLTATWLHWCFHSEPLCGAEWSHSARRKQQMFSGVLPAPVWHARIKAPPK